MTLPAVTPQINVDEYELSRIQSNLAGTTDAILSFLTTNFTILATGAPATVNAPSTIPQAPAYPLTAPAGSAAAYNFVNTSTGQWFDSLGSFSGSPGLVWKVNGTDQAGIDQTGTLSTGFVDILRVILHAISSGGASTSNITVQAGIGAPAGTCPKGSVYLRSDGGAGTTLYINETGTSTWRAI